MAQGRIDRYDFSKQALVEDSFGSLYEGTDKETGDPVYLKELRSRPSGKAGLGGWEGFTLLHGGLIKASGVAQDDGKRYLVLPKPDGELLNSCLPRLRTGGLTGRHQLLLGVIQICRAVENLHRAGLYHGQISPASVQLRLQPTLEAYLLCFEPFQPAPAHHFIANNPFLPYLSPEQLRGGGEPASDVYALGVLLHDCFSKHLPLGGRSCYETAEHIMWGELTDFLPQLDDLDPALSQAIASDVETVGAIATRALQRNPRTRYSTVGEMARMLEQIAERVSPLALGHNLYLKGQYQQAATVLEESLEGPDAVRALVYLGRIYGLRMKQYEKGVAHFKRALKEKPDLEIAKDGLAELYADNGHFALAKREILDLVRSQPDSMYWNMRYAQVLEEAGENEAAQNVCRKIQQLNPYALPAYVRSVRLYMKQDKLRDAETVCDAGVQNVLKVLRLGNLDPLQVAELFYIRGLLHRKRNWADRALVWFEKAIQQSPYHAGSHAALAELYLDAGEPEKALSHFLTGMSLAPDQQKIMEGLARLLNRQQSGSG